MASAAVFWLPRRFFRLRDGSSVLRDGFSGSAGVPEAGERFQGLLGRCQGFRGDPTSLADAPGTNARLRSWIGRPPPSEIPVPGPSPGGRAGEVLAGDERVDCAWLFGSAARGEAGPLSDVDVAALLNPSIALKAEAAAIPPATRVEPRDAEGGPKGRGRPRILFAVYLSLKRRRRRGINARCGNKRKLKAAQVGPGCIPGRCSPRSWLRGVMPLRRSPLRGQPPKEDRPPVLLRGERLEQPDESLYRLPIRSVPEHLLGVCLLPIDTQRRQLPRQHLAGPPDRERCEDAPAAGTVHQGMQTAPGGARPGATPPEDGERPRDFAAYLDIPDDLGPDAGVRHKHPDAIPGPRERRSPARLKMPSSLPQFQVRFSPTGQYQLAHSGVAIHPACIGIPKRGFHRCHRSHLP